LIILLLETASGLGIGVGLRGAVELKPMPEYAAIFAASLNPVSAEAPLRNTSPKPPETRNTRVRQ
jgi:hypothetical protein